MCETRDRARVLIAEYDDKEATSKRDTGVDEEYDEKWQLLTEWSEIIEGEVLNNASV